MEAHGNDFRDEVGNKELAEQLKKDWKKADLTAKDKALCAWAEKLTLSPGDMQKLDIDALTGIGFSEDAISDAAQVVSYFNYINRIAEGLGVDLENEMK
ncbi:MAG: peroxidase [Candidatus Marinimicrobia bacterium]|nr:peroxidase [Candidatus Neomarinimicrobiota bacterium]MBT3849460.1 peroxidase [Candidatus Neomarinimicrobiota bacterium]MBT4054394.1 peroxidase [Candidatus Neomarinimicrobiota bacterium]MBT4370607.1 peroxidase [Candidatus Neomarinimicrobiota bacterium]MBT4660623.1 peroxidase [Candidatus Neomarinimicrobiota bacterium]